MNKLIVKKMNLQVTDFINKAPEDQKKIMEAIRKLIHEVVPNVVEEFKWSRPVFKADKDFAYLQTTKKHVTLGFFNFEKLDDPNGLLEGTGKDMRHIKIKSMNDFDSDLLNDWFRRLTA
jgi:hypothetical protein